MKRNQKGLVNFHKLACWQIFFEILQGIVSHYLLTFCMQNDIIPDAFQVAYIIQTDFLKAVFAIRFYKEKIPTEMCLLWGTASTASAYVISIPCVDQKQPSKSTFHWSE